MLRNCILRHTIKYQMKQIVIRVAEVSHISVTGESKGDIFIFYLKCTVYVCVCVCVVARKRCT